MVCVQREPLRSNNSSILQNLRGIISDRHFVVHTYHFPIRVGMYIIIPIYVTAVLLTFPCSILGIYTKNFSYIFFSG